MTWVRWIIVALALLNAGYMTVDGARALTKGDYFTPTSGQYAGQLGPWAKAVEAVGIEPRSTAMKVVFVTYGAVWVIVSVAFVLKQPWSWLLMLVLALGSVWYLIVGSVLSVVITALLFLPSVRDLFRS
jgi:hypothetical protein